MPLEKEHRNVMFGFIAAAAGVAAVGAIAAAYFLSASKPLVRPEAAQAEALASLVWMLVAWSVILIEAFLIALYRTMRRIQSGHERHVHEYETRLERILIDRTIRLQESDEHYRKLMETSPDGILIQSEGVIAFMNREGLALLGAKKPAEIVGKRLMGIIHPAYREIAGERMAALKKGLNMPLITEKFLRLDGTAFDAEVVATPFEFEGKQAALAIFRDITRQKRAEEELRRTSWILHGMVRSSPMAMMAVDAAGRVTLWNLAAEALMGWSEREIVGRADPVFFTEQPDDLAPMRHKLKEGLVHGGIMPHRQRKDGSFIDLKMSSAALRENGKLVGTIVIFGQAKRRNVD